MVNGRAVKPGEKQHGDQECNFPVEAKDQDQVEEARRVLSGSKLVSSLGM